MKHILKILRLARELRPYYIAVSLISVGVSLMTLLLPVLSGRAIDELRNGSTANIQFLVVIAVVIFALDVLTTVLSNVGGYLGDQMSTKLNHILATRYYEHLLKLPQHYFDTELSGKIINRLNRSIVQLTNFTQMMSNNFLQFIFTTVFSLAVVAYYSWQVALLLFLLYPIYIWLTVRTSNVWQEYQTKKNNHFDIATGRFAEAIGQIKVVKSYIQQANELKFFNKEFASIINVNKPQSRYWHERDVRRRLVLNVIFLAVYLFIFIQGAHGHYSPGVAVSLILLAMQIRIPIFTISFLVENTQRAVADSKDYFEVLNITPDIADRPGARDLTVKRGAIEFNDVVFGYDKQTVLNGISLSIKPDSKVALVGESGEGKTTVTNLLLRLYEPSKGAITIDGEDIQDVSQQSLRRNIGVVFQDPALFSGTIKENIAYGNSKASPNQVVAAAKAANAHEFIEKLESGYDTQIGERGLKLSGGQKQRIAIARALLKDAPILILDEATSSLDSRSEVMVQEALEKLMKGRTTLIIAHRLSTIQNVDQIITLKGGKVDEIGSPAKLAKSGGIYTQLLKLQNGSSETTKKKLKAFDLAE